MVAADEVDAFAAAAQSELGRIDLWINNAAVLGPIGPVRSVDSTAWRRAVDVNLNGTFNGSRAFLANASDSGVLVNIASRAGTRSAAGLSAYSATKAGVIALSTAIAEEQADTGLRTIVVIPPSIDTACKTPSSGRSRSCSREWRPPEDGEMRAGSGRCSRRPTSFSAPFSMEPTGPSSTCRLRRAAESTAGGMRRGQRVAVGR